MSSFLGTGTANGLAKLYSYLSMEGEVKGKQLLSSKTRARLMTPMRTVISEDQVIGVNNTYGPGLSFKKNPYSKFKVGFLYYCC